MPPAAFLHPEMHQNRWRLGLCPTTHWRSLQRSPGPLAGLRGPTSKGRGEEGRGGEKRGGTLDPHNVGDRLTPLIWPFNAADKKTMVYRNCMS